MRSSCVAYVNLAGQSDRPSGLCRSHVYSGFGRSSPTLLISLLILKNTPSGCASGMDMRTSCRSALPARRSTATATRKTVGQQGPNLTVLPLFNRNTDGAYGSRIAAGTPALRASSSASSIFCLASSRVFCLSAICCLYWVSSLSQFPELRRRLPASA